jgi:lipopolysaccharide transport system permease protein
LSDSTVLPAVTTQIAVTERPATSAPQPAAEAAPLALRPTSGWSALQLREVWQFRDLMFTLAGRDLKLRYKQTALGAVWVVLQPLAAAGILNFVFGTVAGMKTTFAMTFAGTIAWSLFSNTLSKTSGCLVGNAHLISKVFFPRLILPLSSIPSTLVDFAVAMIMMAVLIAMHGPVPALAVLLLPVWIAFLLMLSLGIGMVAASLMVTYRDVGYVLPVVIQLLMFGSPVAYSSDRVPAQWQMWYQINPLTPLLQGFRWSLVNDAPPNWMFVGCAAAFSVLAMVLGAFSFKRMERRFADVI